MAEFVKVGNIVSPNGASVIFGAESTQNHRDIETLNSDTYLPYDIVIVEEDTDETLPADQITFMPNGSLSSTTVQGAISELDSSIYSIIPYLTSQTITATQGQIKFNVNANFNEDQMLVYYNGLLINKNIHYSYVNKTISLLDFSAEQADILTIIGFVPYNSVINTTRLPNGYEKCSFIATDGTNYIDTNYYPTQNTRIVIDFQNTGDTAKHLFGGRESFLNKAFLVCWESDWVFTIQVGNDSYNAGIFYVNNRHTIDMSSTRFMLDGAINASYTTDAFTSPGSLYIGACSNSDLTTENASMRIYSCKIYDGTNLIRNLIPAREIASGAYGLYDTINSVFYNKAAGNDFTVS